MPNGKAGTLTPQDFETLSNAAGTFGEKVLAAKVAKMCSKRAEKLLHENPSSSVGIAFSQLSAAIIASSGETRTTISRDAYAALNSMVDNYGAEVIMWKLAKIASRRAKSMGTSPAAASVKATATSFKALFR